MKKPEVNPKIYEAWDNMWKRIEERKKKSLLGIALDEWDDVYPLTEAILHGPKITGRSRKQSEDLILVPRFALKYLIDNTLTMIAGRRNENDNHHDQHQA